MQPNSLERIEQLLRMLYHDRAQEVLAEHAIVELVRSGTVSSKKAAELMNLSHTDFDLILAKHNVPHLDITMEDLLTQDETLDKLRNQS